MKLESVILRGTRTTQPVVTTIAPGTLYYVTDEFVTERANGTAWEAFSSTSTLLANNATFAFGKTEGALNANSALFANTAGSATIAGTALTANSATFALTANTANTANSATSALSANTANTANNATFAFGKTEGNLNANSALNANNAANLGGLPPSYYAPIVHSVTTTWGTSDIDNMGTVPLVFLTGVAGLTIMPITVAIRLVMTVGFIPGRGVVIGYSKTIGGGTYGQNLLYTPLTNVPQGGLVDTMYVIVSGINSGFNFNTPGGGEGSPVGKSIVMMMPSGGTGSGAGTMTVTMTYGLLDANWLSI